MRILKKLEDIFAAAAFAEAGEFETAKEMVRDDGKGPGKSRKTAHYEDSSRDNMSEHPSKA